MGALLDGFPWLPLANENILDRAGADDYAVCF